MRRVGLVLVLMALWVLVGVPRLVGAQATPEASTTVSCDVRAIAIGVTVTRPGATPSPVATVAPPEGPAVDEATVDDLQATLDELRACVAEGDIGKVAALFSEEGFARVALADEPVKIELLPEGATPPAGRGPWEMTSTVEPGIVERAVALEDGSVVAYVDTGTGAPRLITFVREDGRWVIDDVSPLAPDVAGGAATPIRPLGAEDVPAEVWDAVVGSLGLTADATITVVALEAVDWPDSSLGCPEEGSFYAQVITPGYRIVVEVDGARTEIHTDLIGNATTCVAS